ncbi:MAG: hypothetical protein ING52_10620 [Burkholderiales bacterium]|nr:hypothetical protein [Burkholderiales bacterium]
MRPAALREFDAVRHAARRGETRPLPVAAPPARPVLIALVGTHALGPHAPVARYARIEFDAPLARLIAHAQALCLGNPNIAQVRLDAPWLSWGERLLFHEESCLAVDRQHLRAECLEPAGWISSWALPVGEVFARMRAPDDGLWLHAGERDEDFFRMLRDERVLERCYVALEAEEDEGSAPALRP